MQKTTVEITLDLEIWWYAFLGKTKTFCLWREKEKGMKENENSKKGKETVFQSLSR